MHPYDEKNSKCTEKLHGITQPDNEAGSLKNMIKMLCNILLKCINLVPITIAI
jgi:hypothetical protein